MLIPSEHHDFWRAFCASHSDVDESRFYEAFYFGDNETLANQLAEQVLSGVKRASAGLLTTFEAMDQALPKPGDLSIVTSFAGDALCIIETQSIELVPFNEVGAQFAHLEGADSLAQWQQAHQLFFARECAAQATEFDENMMLVCETFHCIFPKLAAAEQR